MRVTTLAVDFNDIDNDVVKALWPEGQPDGEPGSQYHLIDGDGTTSAVDSSPLSIGLRA